MKNNTSKIFRNQIKNILTVRYNPEKTSLIQKKQWLDFQPLYSDPTGKHVEELLTNSILKNIPDSNEPIVISLSSGIDSALCLALLRKIYPKRKIISLCGVFAEGFDESKDARLIAEKFDSDFKIVKMDSVFTTMPELINISKKPKWNTYQHLIAKECKKYSKIFVTGDGADELFAGYSFRYTKFLKSFSSKMNWLEKTKLYLNCHNRDWVEDQHDLFHKKINFDWNLIYKFFKPYFSNRLDPLNQVLLSDFNGKLLFDFLPSNKLISKHYNLTTTPIFLNNDLINFALHLPTQEKFDNNKGIGKLTLRKISKRLKIPHIEHKKGFSPALFFDWEIHGNDICQSYLLDKNANIYQNNIINYDWVVKAFEKTNNDGDIRYLNRLISILAVEIWFNVFITKQIKPLKKL